MFLRFFIKGLTYTDWFSVQGGRGEPPRNRVTEHADDFYGQVAMSRIALPFLLMISLLFSGGCTAIIAGGATGTLTGLEYVFDNLAHKTFTSEVATVKSVSIEVLEEMGFNHEETVPTRTGFKISAATKQLAIEIEIERVTTRASRVTVNAKRGWFRKDHATASEIIRQMELLIHHQVARTERTSRKRNGPLTLMIP